MKIEGSGTKRSGAYIRSNIRDAFRRAGIPLRQTEPPARRTFPLPAVCIGRKTKTAEKGFFKLLPAISDSGAMPAAIAS